MKRKSILMFLILLFSFISFMPYGFADYVYVEDSYQVNESKDDAVYYVGFNYYDDDSFLLITSNLYDVKTGIVFNNISIYDNATFVEAYLSLYSNDSYTDDQDYWVTIYGIDEDNISSFSNFEDFNNKSYTSQNSNWNLKDLEGLDTWVNSTNLASLFNEVKSRSGWSSGNNLGLYILSVKSSDAYRMCLSYDGNSSYAPKLYLKYRYYVADGVGEELEFVEEYRDYDIYVNVTEAGFDYGNYTLYDITGDMGGGAPVIEIGNLASEVIGYGKSRYWAVGWDSGGDVWIWNSTDKQNWYGSQITTGGYGIILSLGHQGLLSTFDENGDIHIMYKSEDSNQNAYYTYYHKVETFANGSINDLGLQVVSYGTLSSSNVPRHLMVDVQGYPIANIKRGQSPYNHIVGSSTKDGTWVQDYYVDTGSSSVRNQLCPLNTGDGKDFLHFRNNGHYIEAKYFDESIETLGTGSIIDNTLDWYDFGMNKYANSYVYLGVPRIWSSFRGDNETIIALQGYDEVNGDTRVNAYRTVDGGDTWSKKLIYEYDDFSSSDYIGCVVRYNSYGDIFVFYEHDDANEGNKTWYYSALSEGKIDTGFNNTWDKENIEICDFNGLQEGQVEGSALWSIARGGQSIYVIDRGFMVGRADRIMSSVDIFIDSEEGEDHYFIYDDKGDLVMSCFTELEEAEDYIDDLLYEKQFSGSTIMWILGLIGLIMMPTSFVVFVIYMQKGDYSNAFILLMSLFLIGMALFINWMWG